METQELIKKVRRIEIKTRGISNQVFSGEYHSAFKGRGMSFSEVRAYQYGDDVRNIDWNVTARFNQPFIKIFEEERELTVLLMIDVSESSFFGTSVQMKNELITEICAVLSFSAITNNDKVGVIFFSSKIEKFIPPMKGKTHILRIIRELLEVRPTAKGTDIGEALKFMNNVMKKRSIVFLISDFIDHNYEQPINIASRKHDIVGIKVYDEREKTLPQMGLIVMTDAETGQVMMIDTGSENIRNRYARYYAEHDIYFREIFRKCGLDILKLRTDLPYIRELMNFFKKREVRR
ncbi:MAG: DUF58 domain-containing protein [Bacteroidia bacterium]